MKLSEAQLATVKQEWGTKADHIIELLSKKRGRCNYFNEDGSLAQAKDEIESLLSKESKLKGSSKKADWKTVVNAMNFDELEEVAKYVQDLIEKKKADEISILEARLRELKGE